VVWPRSERLLELLLKTVWLWSGGSSPVDFHVLYRNYPVEDSMNYSFEVIITPVVMFV